MAHEATLHPIVAQLQPSPAQLPAITTRTQDVVVTAGAGTGKTRTLVARYLALVSEGVPLRAIVAITFTQKAAREMRNRVRQAVQDYLAQAALDPAERRHWQGIYAQLDAARISTIHSLCSDILRSHPAEARLDPRFETFDEGRTNLLLREVTEAAMAWAADEPELLPLYDLLGERELRHTLSSLLRQRLDVEPLLAGSPAERLARWEQKLRQAQQAQLTALLADPVWQDSLAVLRHNPATNPTDKRELTRQDALAAIAAANGDLPSQVASLSRLDSLNLVGGSAKSWPGGSEQAEAVKAALRELRELWRAHSPLLSLSLTDHDAQLAEAISRLRRLFESAAERYAAHKRERNALDFDDLEARALVLLNESETARRYWQSQIEAILIDEFQDTNHRQRDLLNQLAGRPGKRFMVGDAKQSIYRFRGADVSVFRAERELVAQNGGRHLDLNTSYRAHQALLTGMNDLLRPVLGQVADSNRPWREPFAPLEPHRRSAGEGLSAPFVELHLAVGSKSSGGLERAAAGLVSRLVELVDGGRTFVGVGARAEPLGYGHVAILCRASGSFEAYENALEQAGVPFLTVAGRGFYQRPEIREVLNALQALADPTDDLALAGLLRFPAFALPDSLLVRLHEARPAPETPLWQVLSRQLADLPPEWAEPTRRAQALIARLQGQVGRVTVADLLKTFLDESGYRAALLRTGQKRAARNISKLLADANSSGLVLVGEFLDYVTGLRDTGTREGEARATSEGVVQLMTIHAAKGLEFPLVVLGDITYGGRGQGGELLLDPELGLLLPYRDEAQNQAAGYQLGKLVSDDQAQAELDRLLYVALTRAQELLLLNGCVRWNEKTATLAGFDGWLKQLVSQCGVSLPELSLDYNEAGQRRHVAELRVEQTEVGVYVYEPDYPFHRSGAVSPAAAAAPPAGDPLPPPLLGPLSPVPTARDEAAEASDYPRKAWRVVPPVTRPRAPAWVIGQLVHSSLAAWRFPGPDYAVWAGRQARHYGLTSLPQIIHTAVASKVLLRRFRAHPLSQRLEQAEQRWHEVPYTLLVDGQPETGLIDCLFREAGRWHLVEFKTDQVRDEAHLSQLFAETDYVAQLRRYRQAAEQVLGQPVGPLLCWLNYQGQVLVQADPEPTAPAERERV